MSIYPIRIAALCVSLLILSSCDLDNNKSQTDYQKLPDALSDNKSQANHQKLPDALNDNKPQTDYQKLLVALNDNNSEALIKLNPPEDAIFITSPYTGTALQLAVKNGDTQSAQYLVSRGASFLRRDYDGNTALHYAMQSTSLQMLEYVLENSIDFDVQNKMGDTPLHIGVANGWLEGVKLLVNSKVRINLKNNKLLRAIDLSIINHQEPITRFLLAQSNLHLSINTLNIALAYASVDINHSIIEKSSLIHQPGASGIFPIHVAAASGRGDLVQLLLNKGAYLNQLDRQGYSVLHYFAMGISEQTVTVIESDKPKHKKRNYGEESISKPLENKTFIASLAKATTQQRQQLFTLITAQLPDLERTSPKGETALALATTYNNTPVTLILINAGASITSTKLLPNAVMHDNLQLVKLLAEGIDLSGISDTLYRHAAASLKNQSVDYLQSKGLPLPTLLQAVSLNDIQQVEAALAHRPISLDKTVNPNTHSIIDSYTVKRIIDSGVANQGSNILALLFKSGMKIKEYHPTTYCQLISLNVPSLTQLAINAGVQVTSCKSDLSSSQPLHVDLNNRSAQIKQMLLLKARKKFERQWEQLEEKYKNEQPNIWFLKFIGYDDTELLKFLGHKNTEFLEFIGYLTAYDIAILNGNIDDVETLLQQGQAIDSVSNTIFFNDEPRSAHWSALRLAIEVGQLDMVELLLKRGATLRKHELMASFKQRRTHSLAILTLMAQQKIEIQKDSLVKTPVKLPYAHIEKNLGMTRKQFDALMKDQPDMAKLLLKQYSSPATQDAPQTLQPLLNASLTGLNEEDFDIFMQTFKQYLTDKQLVEAALFVLKKENTNAFLLMATHIPKWEENDIRKLISHALKTYNLRVIQYFNHQGVDVKKFVQSNRADLQLNSTSDKKAKAFLQYLIQQDLIGQLLVSPYQISLDYESLLARERLNLNVGAEHTKELQQNLINHQTYSLDSYEFFKNQADMPDFALSGHQLAHQALRNYSFEYLPYIKRENGFDIVTFINENQASPKVVCDTIPDICRPSQSLILSLINEDQAPLNSAILDFYVTHYYQPSSRGDIFSALLNATQAGYDESIADVFNQQDALFIKLFPKASDKMQKKERINILKRALFHAIKYSNHDLLIFVLNQHTFSDKILSSALDEAIHLLDEPMAERLNRAGAKFKTPSGIYEKSWYDKNLTISDRSFYVTTHYFSSEMTKRLTTPELIDKLQKDDDDFVNYFNWLIDMGNTQLIEYVTPFTRHKQWPILIAKALQANKHALVKTFMTNYFSANDPENSVSFAQKVQMMDSLSILQQAIRTGDMDLMKFIINNQMSSLQSNGKRGDDQPIIVAINEHQVEMLDYLLQYGLGFRLVDIDFEAFFKSDDTAVLSYFFDLGLDPNTAISSRKVSLLQLAANFDSIAHVKFLISKNAHVHARDTRGKSALDYAVSKDHHEVAAYLEKMMATMPETQETSEQTQHHFPQSFKQAIAANDFDAFENQLLSADFDALAQHELPASSFSLHSSTYYFAPRTKTQLDELIFYYLKHQAIQSSAENTASILNRAINAGLNLDNVNDSGQSMMSLAVSSKNKTSINLLVEHSAGLELDIRSQLSPLMIAAKNDMPEVFIQLINAGSDPLKRVFKSNGKKQANALSYAIENNSVNVLKRFYNRKQVKASYSPELYQQPRLIREKLDQNQFAMVDYLSQLSLPELEDNFDSYKPLLTYAAKSDKSHKNSPYQLVDLLLKNGTNPFKRKPDQPSAFSYAVNLCDFELATRFVTHTASKALFEPAYFAAKKLKVKNCNDEQPASSQYLAFLMQHGLSPTSTSSGNYTVDIAIKNGNYKIAKQLHEQGFKQNITKDALYLAILDALDNRSNLETVIWLWQLKELSTDAVIDNKPFLFSLLDIKRSLSHKFISYLASQQYNFNVSDAKGNNAILHLAKENEYRLDFDVFELLLNSKIEVNHANKNGLTALMQLAKSGNNKREIYLSLLSKGADINQQDLLGKSVLSYLFASPKTGDEADMKLIDYLVQRGGDLSIKGENNTNLIWLVLKSLPSNDANFNSHSADNAHLHLNKLQYLLNNIQITDKPNDIPSIEEYFADELYQFEHLKELIKANQTDNASYASYTYIVKELAKLTPIHRSYDPFKSRKKTHAITGFLSLISAKEPAELIAETNDIVKVRVEKENYSNMSSLEITIYSDDNNAMPHALLRNKLLFAQNPKIKKNLQTWYQTNIENAVTDSINLSFKEGRTAVFVKGNKDRLNIDIYIRRKS